MLKINISINSDAPKLDYGNGQRPLAPSRGVWRGENMKFLMPKSGMKYIILNANYRTSRNELSELAGMVSIYILSTTVPSLFLFSILILLF